MAISKANATKKLKLIGLGALVGLLVGAFSVFMLFTYNPPDKENEATLDVSILMSEIERISELATASQTYTVVEKVESNSKLFDTIDIPFSENFFILTYMGEVKAGVNLDEAQITLEGTTVKVSLPQATILSDAIDTASFKVLHEQNNFLNPIGVEDVTQYIDESRQKAEAAAISGEVLTEAQANAESSIKALLSAAIPEGYVIEVSSAVQE
ncbi:DUF4230 domain-containing protein [Adlercreutzia sp. R25]|uniref:DUF4230 domain-containing protein n=1 Tax=Adlercreutzia shanghongiae TaxID=3111773 RepID=UPI002DB59539|nr:DUF4230 domain-containing protein [Adlercreutzia sp. R25]MEC4273350.1 DUF4230 domain-containing protein [Adlercreutzia sp. R25]